MTHPSIQKAREILSRGKKQEAAHAVWAADHAEELMDAETDAETDAALALVKKDFAHERTVQSVAARNAQTSATWNKWFIACFDARIRSVIIGIAKKVAASNKGQREQIAGLRGEIADLRTQIEELRQKQGAAHGRLNGQVKPRRAHDSR